MAHASRVLLRLLLAAAVAACGTSTAPTASPGGSAGAPTVAPSATSTPSGSATAAPSASTAPSASVVPSVSAAPSSSPSAAPSRSPTALRWAGGTVIPATPDSVLTGIAATPSSLVAMGLADIDGAGSWISENGDDWQPITSSELVGVGLATVTATADGLVAVGRELNPEVDRAVVARSPDGRTWTREDGGAAFDGAQMIDVVAALDGLVAVGSAPGTDSAAVWLKPGTGPWERVAADSVALEAAFMWSVTVAGPGLIAGGWRREGEPTAAIWTSTDGRNWSLATSIEGGSGMQVRSVIETASGYVAVGERVEGGSAAVWTSTDGGTWTRVESPTFANASMVDVAATEFGLVAVGGRNLDDAGVWISADGSSWEVVEDPDLEGAFFTAVMGWNGRLIAVGATQVPIGNTGSYDVRGGAWATLP